MSEFKNALATMSEAYESGKKLVDGLPDGQYLMELDKAEAKVSSNGNPMIHRVHVVIDGEFAGTYVHDNVVLNNPFGFRGAIDWVKTLGYEPPAQIEDWESMVAELNSADPKVQVIAEAKSKDGFTNIRVKSLAEVQSSAPAPKKLATTTPAAVKKAAPAVVKKAEEPEEPKLAEGTVVTFDLDGTLTKGKVVAVAESGNYNVEVENGDVYEIEADALSVVPEEEEATEEPAAEEPQEDTTELIAFCQAHDIGVAEDEAADSIRSKIVKFEYNRDELTKEEVELLEKIGAKFAAAKPAPKPTPKATPKPATKAPAKAVAKPTPKKKK
jgi:hypothetical protein